MEQIKNIDGEFKHRPITASAYLKLLKLLADIVAKVPNCPALIFLLQKIRPTTADRCGLNHVTEVASEFIFRQ